MERTISSARFVVSLLALAAGACATNTSDETRGAAGNAGTTSANAGASAAGSGAGGSTTSPNGGAGGALATAGSSTGGANAGGTNAGGTSAGSCATIDPADLISDFESGKAQVAMVGTRGGSWFLFNDGTGTQTPPKTVNTPLAAEGPGACNSLFAFHSTGMGFTVFGAGFGADFVAKPAMSTASLPLDASAYTGLALRAKSAAAIDLRVSVSDSGTAPEGMKCHDTTDKTDKLRCGDYFGTDVTLGTDWQDFVLPFAAMKQRGFGMPVPSGLDDKQVYTVRAQIKGSAAAPGAYDIWIDDVRFVK